MPLLGLLLRVKLLDPLLLPFLYPLRAGGVRLIVLERERDGGDPVRCEEREGVRECDRVGDGSRIAAAGVPDRVRERPREGDRERETMLEASLSPVTASGSI